MAEFLVDLHDLERGPGTVPLLLGEKVVLVQPALGVLLCDFTHGWRRGGDGLFRDELSAADYVRVVRRDELEIRRWWEVGRERKGMREGEGVWVVLVVVQVMVVVVVVK